MKLEKIQNFVIVNFSLLMLLFISGLFQGCEKEEIDDLEVEITKDDIINLANEYGIPLDFDNSKNDYYEIGSLEELEKIFISIEKHRIQSISKKTSMVRNGGLILFETRQKRRDLPRLKNGNESGIWGESAWFFNLTWLSSSVGYQSDTQEVTVTSRFNGISL